MKEVNGRVNNYFNKAFLVSDNCYLRGSCEGRVKCRRRGYQLVCSVVFCSACVQSRTFLEVKERIRGFEKFTGAILQVRNGGGVSLPATPAKN